jgi:hypothetical protein
MLIGIEGSIGIIRAIKVKPFKELVDVGVLYHPKLALVAISDNATAKVEQYITKVL